VVSLDSLINTIQWRHHNVRSDHIALSNDCAIHDFGLECPPLFLSPLADPALGLIADMILHNETNKILPKIVQKDSC
jgi:hypothetical protein